MSTSKLSKFALALVLAGGAIAFAADEAKHETSPKSESAKTEKAGKLVKPWDDINSLTDDQKEKIGEIHKKSLEEIKTIQKKEHDDIMALLTDAQKAELKSAQEKEAAEKKAAHAEKKADKANKKADEKEMKEDTTKKSS